MPRLLGVEIPANKRIAFAIRYIYGIGATRAVEIVDAAGLDHSARAKDLSEEELNKIVQVIQDKAYKVEGDLRREVTGNLKRLSAIRSYRGIRHQRGLPVRGQRTQTNARTRKGGRKTVGIIKKK